MIDMYKSVRIVCVAIYKISTSCFECFVFYFAPRKDNNHYETQARSSARRHNLSVNLVDKFRPTVVQFPDLLHSHFRM